MNVFAAMRLVTNTGTPAIVPICPVRTGVAAELGRVDELRVGERLGLLRRVEEHARELRRFPFVAERGDGRDQDRPRELGRTRGRGVLERQAAALGGLVGLCLGDEGGVDLAGAEHAELALSFAPHVAEAGKQRLVGDLDRLTGFP
ncbi:hypothetical protein AB0I84_29215 [Streptomyces spectabilis]|uniref:hypothetical protein n=1 Tax=Streptomyces spectabilis TaxID=68270 RepID=UPI0033C49051